MYSLLLLYDPSATCESTKDFRASGKEMFIVLIPLKIAFMAKFANVDQIGG